MKYEISNLKTASEPIYSLSCQNYDSKRERSDPTEQTEQIELTFID